MTQKKHRTPSSVYESILQELNTDPERINLVEKDQELILSGWEIHFAFDPYDIGEFCFPFSRMENALHHSLIPHKVDQISKLQNGRYEAIYNVTHKPILLSAYEKELEDLVNWAEWSKFVSKDSDAVDKYLEILSIPPGEEPGETKDTLQRMTDADISSVIAVVTGIVSVGFKNLTDLVRKQLVHGRLDNYPERKAPALEYRQEVVNKILSVFKAYFDDNRAYLESKGKYIPSSQRSRSRQLIDANNQRDAKAFDQLLKLNQIYNKDRQLILYFSSSPKSLYLDRFANELRDYYPVVNGEPYKLVRTATDLFVYMVYKGDSNSPEPRTRFAKNRLKDLAEMIARVEQIRDALQEESEKCAHCHGNNAAPLCKFGMLCEAIFEYGEHLEARQDSNVNYSLQKRLAEVLEETKSQQTSTRHEAIRKIIYDIIKEKGVVTAKDQELRIGLQTILNKADFASTAVSRTGEKKDYEVSCYLNSYPVNLALNDRGLREVFNGVIDLLKFGWSDHAFDELLSKYIKLDRKWDEEPETEMLRSFLYLIMGEAGKARHVASKYLVEEKLPVAVRREFRYIQCFILWSERQYQRAIDTSTKGIELFPEDGRFYHCRSVVTLSQLIKYKEKGLLNYSSITDETMRAIGRMMDDTLQAIERFSANPRMLAVCYNNMAYCVSERDFGLVDVQSAQEYLRRLTELIPEAQWEPYPEFFHTKGSVLYSKFLEDKTPATLHEAYDAANEAMRIYPKAEHEKLVNLIKGLFNLYGYSFNPGSKMA
ncbi:MAG TPA: hypothetical protein VGP08_23565 [Pyrinomonadaceae bacterium]|jgi:hypothetical protein|nr:hypothetical protein [Pyrinomonadaceae bacterium]